MPNYPRRNTYNNQNKNKQNELTETEKEHSFARWFWAGAEASSWSASKVLLTFVGAVTIGVFAYIGITALPLNPVATVVIVGLLFSGILLINADFRGWLTRQVQRRRHYDHVDRIAAYDAIQYYFLKDHTDVLFIENGRDLTGVALLKLKAIPINITGNFERFIRSLYQQQIPIFWTYVQTPVDQGAILSSPAITDAAREFYEDKPPYETEHRFEAHDGIWVARIVFGTRRTVQAGADLEVRQLTLYQQLKSDLFKIHTAFTSAYPHTVLESLKGDALIKAHSVAITSGGVPAFF
jgi:hypothetical protein